ncbi:FecR family protein [Echinicola vietnamensis]|uniref:Fe2+-dicitrate sensor, membrane component n=1 Tax=Echinicola vietnamensis (strain DSM 17526 / LMG 23754 / KMM 6221) TaxID=926556 RepID=L0FY53_ECHVK|nr:FecR family protein [Echinicola vietnamensis]AGA78227.1 Fe2+-dicitrate sensor, membrane component [Echinicola vietnamensis DSM 17526]
MENDPAHIARVIYLLKKQAGNQRLELSEQVELSNWINQSPKNKQLFEQLQDSTQRDQWLDQINGYNTSQALERVHNRINRPSFTREQTPESQTRVLRKMILSIAASLVILLGIGYFFRFELLSILAPVKMETMLTHKMERKTITLPDGTQVWLSPRSILEYPEEFRGPVREVNLKGEAFFEVQSDKQHPFIIHSELLETKVLGTSFNLTAYEGDKEVRVTLLEGVVSLKVAGEKNKSPTILHPNEQAVFEKENRSIRKEVVTNARKYLSRRNGIFRYEATSLDEVVRDMALQYGVKIQLDSSLTNREFYGTMSTEDELVVMLEKIGLVMNAGWFKMSENTYRIKPK